MDVIKHNANRFCIVLFLFVLGYTSSSTAKEFDEVLELYVGQTEVISHTGVSRVSIGSGELASVKVLKDAGQLLLIGKKVGLTDLRVWKRNKQQKHYLIRILNQPPEVALDQVRKHLEDVEGINIRRVGDQIIIEGSSLRQSDQIKVDAVTKQYPNVTSYVTAGGNTSRHDTHGCQGCGSQEK